MAALLARSSALPRPLSVRASSSPQGPPFATHLSQQTFSFLLIHACLLPHRPLEEQIQAHSSWRRLSGQRSLQVLSILLLPQSYLLLFFFLHFAHVSFRACFSGSRCGLCDTYYIAHVKNACAFLGDGMSRIEVLSLTCTAHC